MQFLQVRGTRGVEHALVSQDRRSSRRCCWLLRNPDFQHRMEMVQARSPEYLGKVAMVPLGAPDDSIPLTARCID